MVNLDVFWEPGLVKHPHTPEVDFYPVKPSKAVFKHIKTVIKPLKTDLKSIKTGLKLAIIG